MNDPMFYHFDNGVPKTHRLKLFVDGKVKVIWELESSVDVEETICRYNLNEQMARDPGVTFKIEDM
jgi:hypothetical protein